jgi:ankyrin repeat protein
MMMMSRFPAAETKTTTKQFYKRALKRELRYPTYLPSHLFTESVRRMKQQIQNVTIPPHPNPDLNPRVMLVNLQSTAMNGKCGVRGAWNNTQQRFVVKLDGGDKTVWIKKENLEVIKTRVRLVNLNSKLMNGKYGTRTKWIPAKQRYQVVLDNGQKVAIRPENLEKAQPHPPCPHLRCSLWNTKLCANCKAELPPERVDLEKVFSQRLKEEDHAKARLQPHHERIHSLGVHVDALLKFAYDHDCWDWPTWKVVRDIIVPATRDTRCRYGDLPESTQCFGPARVFMSHCWGACFGDLVGAACHGAREDRYVWIDIFAVRQWPGNRGDLNFRQVLNLCQAMIVSISPVEGLKEFMPDGENGDYAAFFATPVGRAAKKCLPMFRLWCIVEIADAIERKIPVIVKGGQCTSRGETYEYVAKNVGSMMDNLTYMIDIEASECAVRVDYDRELAFIRGLEGGVERVNKIVSGIICGSAYTILENMTEIDAFVCGEKESLRYLLQPMKAGCNEEQRLLAIKILRVAGSSGRVEIVGEVLSKWRQEVNQESEERKGDEDHRETSMLRALVDDSGVLYCASLGGHVEVVRLLLGVRGVNLNLREAGKTALWVACEKGFVSVVQLLLAKGGEEIDVNQSDARGIGPLLVACQKSRMEISQLLLARMDIDVNQAETTTGCTPLYMASQLGQHEIVRLILARGDTDVNRPTRSTGSSALSFACGKGDVDMVRLLLARKEIAVNQMRNDGASSLYMACEYGHAEIARLLLTREEIDVNQPNNEGWSPLLQACKQGHTEVVRLLLARETLAVNQPSSRGATPIFMASMNGQIEIVRLLLQHSEIDAHQRANGYSPFFMACAQGHIEVVRLLLSSENNIDVNETCNGCTPLKTAMIRNHHDVAQVLIYEYGAETPSRNL